MVDDDSIVCRLASKGLEALGYRVLSTGGGKEGVELYRRHQGEIRAVLLDLAMPVMSGREAFLELKKIDPEVKVILASGFRQDERIEEILLHGAKLFLQKPYDLNALVQALEKVLKTEKRERAAVVATFCRIAAAGENSVVA